MKKLLVILRMVSCFFGCSTRKTYNVEYLCDKGAFKGAKDKYKAGETVKLTFTAIATDTDYFFYIDGESVGYKNDDSGLVLTFTMPEHDISVDYSSLNTMVWPEDVLKEIRTDNYPAILGIAYLGWYDTEDGFRNVIDNTVNSLGYDFVERIDSNHLVQVYEEGVDMQVYLVVPRENTTVTVSQYDMETNTLGEILYKDEKGDPFLLVCPDLYGNPCVEIDAENDGIVCGMCPALELVEGGVRVGMMQTIVDFTNSEIERKDHLIELLGTVYELDGIWNSDKNIKALWDTVIDNRYCAVFGVGQNPENDGEYYAVKPGTLEVYKSDDFYTWEKIK